MNTNSLSYMNLRSMVEAELKLMTDGMLPVESQPWAATLIAELLGRLENTTAANAASISAYQKLNAAAGPSGERDAIARAKGAANV